MITGPTSIADMIEAAQRALASLEGVDRAEFEASW
jgi:hypothetical protein